ncbi:MAG: hypothetical protein SF162_12600 [bacterium]|nr:hypothetical protein [bacterium]
MNDWTQYEDGATIGKKGNEGGLIIRDEVHETGGRITLEQDCLRAPHAITAVIYGWLMHTRFLADEPTALHEYTRMQPALVQIGTLLNADGIPDDVDAMDMAVARFSEQFP